jgi:hypothetical protein
MADFDKPNQGERRDRLSHGRAADPEGLRQLPLRRHTAAGLDPT